MLGSQDENELHQWLTAFKKGAIRPVSNEDRRNALAFFSPERNKGLFLDYLRNATTAAKTS